MFGRWEEEREKNAGATLASWVWPALCKAREADIKAPEAKFDER